MTQMMAILTDSLRALRSRFLFWLSLAISVLSAFVLFGMVSFNEEGIRILWFKTMESPTLAAGTEGPKHFMSLMFSGFYVKFWLSWGAMILAVISTSNILPDFLAGGAIDVSLSKPIARARLILLKVLGALLFVAVQVALGVLVAFVLIGVKVGHWMPEMLWAIPLIVLQFFFIYSFSALIAVLTRSTLASLIMSLLFWFLIFIIQLASNQLDSFVGQSEHESERLTAAIQRQFDRIEGQGKEPTKGQLGARNAWENQLSSTTKLLESVEPWQRWMSVAKTGVPKTGDIQTIITNLSDTPTGGALAQLFVGDNAEVNTEDFRRDLEKADAGEMAVRNLNTAKSLLSSTAISAVILGLGVWWFQRRDF